MLQARLGSAVPLPEIPQHTEDIVFGTLGLPIGFDQERVLVNLRAIERVRRVAGFSVISVVSRDQSSELSDPGVTAVDASGTATMGQAAKRRRQPLSVARLSYHDPDPLLHDFPDLTIHVDKSELENRVEEERDRYKQGAFDVQGRARYLNTAIGQGLVDASFDANLNLEKLGLTVGLYGAMTMGEFAYGMPRPFVFALFAGAGVGLGAFPAIHAMMKLKDKDERAFALKQWRYSMFFGLTPDRFLAARGLITASRFVKARK